MTVKRGIVLCTLALVLVAGAMASYVFIASQDDAIADTLDRLAAYEAVIATQPQLQAELERVRQQSASLTGLVPGTSAALAAASIQNDVRTIASRIGGDVRSTQNLPPTVIESFEKVEIACDLTVPMNRLTDLLYQVEAHTPYLFLDRITMEVPESVSPRAGSAQTRVDIHFVVRGYRWVGA
jgi:Type II secretion system (T2SS), protein M subtype b